MDLQRLESAFEAVKTAANLDYAISSFMDEHGEDMHQAQKSLDETYGPNATGIWVKRWECGINKSWPIGHVDKLYVCHSITDEQGEILVKTLEQLGYTVYPRERRAWMAFQLSEN